MSHIHFDRKKHVFMGLTLFVVFLSALVWQFLPAQDPPAYFDFADQRIWFGIPNAQDVVSNLGFLFVGLYAIWQIRLHRLGAQLSVEHRRLILTLAIGSVLTFWGSSYFHWEPNTSRLFWDRLPLSIVFSSLIALLVVDRVDPQWGIKTAWILIPAGVFTVIGWSTEVISLRPYIILQFGGILLAVAIVASLRKGRLSNQKISLGLGAYGLAKLFELWDRPIFELSTQFTGFHLISGHSLKHYFAAVALWAIFKAGENTGAQTISAGSNHTD